MKKLISVFLCLCALLIMFTGCKENAPGAIQFSAEVYRADSQSDEGMDFLLSRAANPDFISPGEKDHPLVIFIDSAQMAVEFADSLSKYYQSGQSYNVIALDDKLRSYDDDYFSGNVLLVIASRENSGSNKLTVKSLDSADGHLSVDIRRSVPDVQTGDVADRFIIIELTMSSFYGTTHMDARISDGE